jgi:hypothetical protein
MHGKKPLRVAFFIGVFVGVALGLWLAMTVHNAAVA